jgi:hypothetical protein
MTSVRSVVFSGYFGFLHQENWPPRYNWNIVESGIKHQNPKPIDLLKTNGCYFCCMRAHRFAYMCFLGTRLEHSEQSLFNWKTSPWSRSDFFFDFFFLISDQFIQKPCYIIILCIPGELHNSFDQGKYHNEWKKNTLPFIHKMKITNIHVHLI